MCDQQHRSSSVLSQPIAAGLAVAAMIVVTAGLASQTDAASLDNPWTNGGYAKDQGSQSARRSVVANRGSMPATYSEKGSPSPAGILFSFPAGIFCPARSRSLGVISGLHKNCPAAGIASRRRRLWSTIRVVNYLLKGLLKVVDHTTPGFCDKLLTSADVCVSARNHGAILPRRATPSLRNGRYLNFTAGRIERESRVSTPV
jgi:hypothetical protein